jgi:hypothetical protein
MFHTPVSFLSGNIVKNTFQSEITIPAGNNTGAQAIGVFNSSYSLMMWAGWRTTELTTNHAEDLPRLNDFTGAFPLVANASTNSSNASDDRIVAVSIVEFYPQALASGVEYGEVTISAGSSTANATLTTPVTVADSAVFYLGATTTYTGSNYGRAKCNLELTATDTVTAERFNTNDNVTVRFAVVPFASGVLKHREVVEITQLSGNTTTDYTLSAIVNPNNTMLAYGGFKLTGSATTAESVLPHVHLLDGDTVRQTTRSAPVSVLAQTKVTVLEFQPNFMCGVARGQDDIGSGVTTITPSVGTGCNLTKSVAYCLGYNSEDVIATGETRNNATVKQGTHTAMSIQNGAAGTPANRVSWENAFFR